MKTSQWGVLSLLIWIFDVLPRGSSFSNQAVSWNENRHKSIASATPCLLINTAAASHVRHAHHPRPSTAIHAVPPTLPWVIAHVLGGAAGAPIVATATRRDDGWYRKIPLPSFTPPDYIFAPVWTLLYASMGVAVGRIYHLYKESSTRTAAWALGTWAIHCLLNLSWAPIFFGLQRLRLGLIINMALWGTLAGIIVPSFYSLNPFSALLLLPYLGWLTFATMLNFYICRLNPTVKGYNNAKFQAQLVRLQREAAHYSGLY